MAPVAGQAQARASASASAEATQPVGDASLADASQFQLGAPRPIEVTPATLTTSAPVPGSGADVLRQLAAVVMPFTRNGDGSYSLNMRLHPEDLGEVSVQLTVQGSNINLQMNAQGGDARDLLRQHMGDLRAELESAGFSTGSFDVGSGAGSGRQPAAWSAPAPRGLGLDPEQDSELGAEIAPDPGVRRPTAVAGGLDARI